MSTRFSRHRIARTFVRNNLEIILDIIYIILSKNILKYVNNRYYRIIIINYFLLIYSCTLRYLHITCSRKLTKKVMFAWHVKYNMGHTFGVNSLVNYITELTGELIEDIKQSLHLYMT